MDFRASLIRFFAFSILASLSTEVAAKEGNNCRIHNSPDNFNLEKFGNGLWYIVSYAPIALFPQECDTMEFIKAGSGYVFSFHHRLKFKGNWTDVFGTITANETTPNQMELSNEDGTGLMQVVLTDTDSKWALVSFCSSAAAQERFWVFSRQAELAQPILNTIYRYMEFLGIDPDLIDTVNHLNCSG